MAFINTSPLFYTDLKTVQHQEDSYSVLAEQILKLVKRIWLLVNLIRLKIFLSPCLGSITALWTEIARFFMFTWTYRWPPSPMWSHMNIWGPPPLKVFTWFMDDLIQRQIYKLKYIVNFVMCPLKYLIFSRRLFGVPCLAPLMLVTKSVRQEITQCRYFKCGAL